MKTIKAITEAEISELPKPPEGWIWVKLDTIGELFCGQSPSIKEVNQERRGIPYVTGPEQWDGSKIEETKWTEFPKRLVPEGCIFITVKGAGVGKIFPGISCAIGRDIYAFLPSSKVDFKYTLHAIKHQINLVIMKAQGDIPGLSKNHILDHVIGLCSIEEQRAIVSKIEQLFSELDNGISNLKLAQEQLKVYRQAVLKKAFEGGFIKGTTAYKDVKINGVPAKIPFSWKVCKIGDYAKLQGGFAFKSKEYTSFGIPIVKISNVYYENIDWADKSFISEDRFEEFKEYSLDDGDILIAMTRPVIKSLNTVKTVVVSKKDLPALLNQRVGRFKISDELSKEYLKYFIYTDFFKKRIIEESSSTQQPNISSKKVEDFDFIFPDDTELQHLIVQEIETRLSVCDKIEQDIKDNLEKAEALRQSILKKAFEGKLLNEKELAEVRGAEDWEPAEVLLERIKAEKAGNGKN